MRRRQAAPNHWGMQLVTSEVAPSLSAEDTYEAELSKRIDLARLGFYRQIGRTASERNFYFESVLNLFIAVAQAPLSFAIHRREGGVLRVSFHMCTDKKHQHWFEGVLSSKVFEEGQNCFPLFPKVLNGEYSISVWFMHTKNPLRGDLTTLLPFPGDVEWKALAGEREPWAFKYVADCAKKFFSDDWDGFATDFAPFIGPALKNSLRKLEENHVWVATCAADRSRGANWPPDTAAQIKAQMGVPHPNSEKDDWHRKLSKTLSPTLSAFEFGTNAVSSLLWGEGVVSSASEDDAKIEGGPNELTASEHLNRSRGPAEVENIILMYRAFDRDPKEDDNGRDVSAQGAYPYNVRFLLPNLIDTPDCKPVQFFHTLRMREASNGKVGAVGGMDWLYCSTVDRPGSDKPTDEQILYFMIVSAADEWFWRTLRQTDGPERLLKALSSPVGNASRSVSDPVFNTGLIHYNPMFELGGLDRIRLQHLPVEFRNSAIELFRSSAAEQPSSFDLSHLVGQIDQRSGLFEDIRRIVTFFYFASAMVKGGLNRSEGIASKYCARNLAAVLMPIKIRGSVWAVSLHITLVDPRGPRHQHTWMANFFLMTNQLEAISFVVDRALWDNLERRVTAVLAREIGRAAAPKDGGFDRLEVSLERVNQKLLGEDRLVPFVLPKFSVSWDAVSEFKSNYIRLFPRDSDKPLVESGLDIVLDVEWEIEANPFFVARQEWTGRTSRSLEPAIRLGLEHGLRELAALRRDLLSGPLPDQFN